MTSNEPELFESKEKADQEKAAASRAFQALDSQLQKMHADDPRRAEVAEQTAEAGRKTDQAADKSSKPADMTSTFAVRMFSPALDIYDSCARQLTAGSSFQLAQHEHYPDAGDANQFKLLWVEHGAANNLSAQVSNLLARPSFYAKSASGPSSARINSYLNNSYLSQLERGSYRNRFCAVRAAVPVVPLVCAVSTSRIDTEVLIDCLAAYLGPPMSWPSWL